MLHSTTGVIEVDTVSNLSGIDDGGIEQLDHVCGTEQLDTDCTGVFHFTDGEVHDPISTGLPAPLLAGRIMYLNDDSDNLLVIEDVLDGEAALEDGQTYVGIGDAMPIVPLA